MKPHSESGCGLQSTGRQDSSVEVRQADISRPDTSHMLPFKPSSTSGTYSIVCAFQEIAQSVEHTMKFHTMPVLYGAYCCNTFEPSKAMNKLRALSVMNVKL